MRYTPPNESAKNFYERIKNTREHLTTCEKCACKHCVNYEKCRWEMCRDCGSGEYTLPCKNFKEQQNER